MRNWGLKKDFSKVTQRVSGKTRTQTQTLRSRVWPSSQCQSSESLLETSLPNPPIPPQRKQVRAQRKHDCPCFIKVADLVQRFFPIVCWVLSRRKGLVSLLPLFIYRTAHDKCSINNTIEPLASYTTNDVYKNIWLAQLTHWDNFQWKIFKYRDYKEDQMPKCGIL